MNRADLRQAANIIRRGGIVAYPTESCYGLGCDPRNHAAVKRLLRLKRRPWQQGLILISDHVARFTPFIQPLAPAVRKKIYPTWPGPVTWLVPSRKGVSPWLQGRHANIAVRVTNHPGAAALCRYNRGAIVSTSANRHGRPASRSAGAVRQEFGNHVDYVLVGKLGGLKRATEIRDALTDKIIRPG